MQILKVLNKHREHGSLSPKAMKSALEELGPTFVKMGQIMSTHPELVPKEYCNELGLLRSDVAPMGFDEVRRVIETAYEKPLEEVFSEFDKTPLGSASIAQAHAARLKGGDAVVVKVQREGIYKVMEQDIMLLKKLSPVLKYFVRDIGEVVDFRTLFDEMWETSREEMDFTKEAANGREFYELNKDIKYATCPYVYEELARRTVLVSKYVGGYEIDDVDALVAAGYDMKEVGTKLVNSFAKQIIDDGFFHADPHQGNIRVEDGVIVWIDLGMMGRLTTRDRIILSNTVESVATADIDGIKDAILTIGIHDGTVDQVQLYADLSDAFAKYAGMDLGDMDIAEVMEYMVSVARKHRISVPSGVTMLARGTATLEGVLAQICPEISVLEIMSNAITSKLLHRDIKNDARVEVYTAVRAMKKALRIPALTSDVFASLIKGQTKINVENSDSKSRERARERNTNRLAAAGISGMMMIGSAILCSADIEPKLAAAPVIGLTGFIIGGAVALALLISMALRGGGKER